MYRLSGVPPSVFGLLEPISAFSSPSMKIELPILSSAWRMPPPGPGIRDSSVAPNARL
jgi:hypothetical protein